MNYQKGLYLEVEGNEIFKMMGYDLVSGVINLVTERSVHFKCNETGCIEMFSKEDSGLVTLWTKEGLYETSPR